MSLITQPMKGVEIVDLQSLNYPVAATPKLDGIRALKINGRLVSSTFKPIRNKVNREYFEPLLPDGVDGELISQGFLQTQSDVMTEWSSNPLEYHIFDYVEESLLKPYVSRMETLFTKVLATDRIKLLMPNLIYTYEDLALYEEDCIEAGYEGVMVRDPQGPYKCGRSTLKQGWLLKIKRFHDAEAIIIGLEEMMENVNPMERDNFGLAKRSSHQENKIPKGTLGKFLVTDKDGRKFSVGTGVGLTFELRQEIWDHQEKFLGKTITYKYQYMSEYNIPRHPIFKAFREGY